MENKEQKKKTPFKGILLKLKAYLHLTLVKFGFEFEIKLDR